MANKISIRKIIATANSEYAKWIMNERMAMLVVMAVYIQNTVAGPLLDHAKRMDTPLNVLEPLIATVNSNAMILVVPALFLALFADFPRIDGNTVFFVIRTGKLNWILGQFVFAIYAVISYILFLVLVSVLPVMQNAFFADGWSLAVSRYAKTYPDEARSFACVLLPGNLYNQMSPFYTAIAGTGLLALHLLWIALIMLCFQSFHKKLAGLLAVAASIVLGVGTFVLDNDMMWLFPTARVTLSTHFTEHYAQQKVLVGTSVWYMVSLLAALLFISIICMKRMQFDCIQELD